MAKQHKICVQKSKEKLNQTHNCRKESPIFRNGSWHFLDLECPSVNNNFRDMALECECGSSRPQRESNKLDLLEWKRKNSEGAIFQIENAEQFNLHQLRKQPSFRRRFR